MVTFNFASQNRAVTVNDYNALVRKCRGKYGAPAKDSYYRKGQQNQYEILSYDANGKFNSEQCLTH